MADSQNSTLVEAEAFPGDWLDEADRESVRRRHAESVERWLDAASFANELFKLHAKYDIEQGETGYAAYRLYLQHQYEKMLLTNGPMVDPLGEGCDCLFCRFDHEEISFRPAKAEVANEEKKPEPPVATPVAREVVQPSERSQPQPRPDTNTMPDGQVLADTLPHCSRAWPLFPAQQPKQSQPTGSGKRRDRLRHRKKTTTDRLLASVTGNERFAIANRGPPERG